MAKIKFGMMMTDARGKLGGQVFSKNRSGAYVRTKVSPTNPQTVYQTAVRQSFATFSQDWSGLTQAIRSAWNGAVASWSTTNVFGDTTIPTGKNLFLKLNQQATQAGYTSFTAVPEKLEMVAGVLAATQLNTTGSNLFMVGLSNSPNARVIVKGTGMLSQGTTSVNNKLRDIGTYLCSTYSDTQAYADYVARFGAPTIGSNISIAVKYVLPNGQASPLQITKANVVA